MVPGMTNIPLRDVVSSFHNLRPSFWNWLMDRMFTVYALGRSIQVCMMIGCSAVWRAALGLIMTRRKASLSSERLTPFAVWNSCFLVIFYSWRLVSNFMSVAIYNRASKPDMGMYYKSMTNAQHQVRPMQCSIRKIFFRNLEVCP